jgi:hypothetical protein
MKAQPFGASNDLGTCRWCGRKLRPYPYRDEPWAQGQELGGYGDNHFCGLRCGYEFGLRFAELGKRLEPVK